MAVEHHPLVDAIFLRSTTWSARIEQANCIHTRSGSYLVAVLPGDLLGNAAPGRARARPLDPSATFGARDQVSSAQRKRM